MSSALLPDQAPDTPAAQTHHAESLGFVGVIRPAAPRLKRLDPCITVPARGTEITIPEEVRHGWKARGRPEVILEQLPKIAFLNGATTSSINADPSRGIR